MAARANNAALKAALDPFTRIRTQHVFARPEPKKLSPGNQARKNAKNALSKRLVKRWKKVLNKPNVAARVKEKQNEKARQAAARKANENAKMAAASARARARKEELEAARREMVALGPNAVGRGGKLTKAGKAVAPSNKPRPNTSAAASRAIPPTLNRGPVLSPNARAAMAAAVASAVTAPRATPKPSDARSRLEKSLKKMGRG